MTGRHEVPEGWDEVDPEDRPPREQPSSFHMQDLGVAINGYPLYALMGPLFPEERKEAEIKRIAEMLASVLVQALDSLPDTDDGL